MRFSEVNICNSYVISPDNQLVVMACSNRLSLYSLSAEKHIALFNQCQNPTMLTFSPDSSLLAVISKKTCLLVIQVHSQKLVATFQDVAAISEIEWLQNSRALLILTELALKASVLDLVSKQQHTLKNPKQSSGKIFALAKEYPFFALLQRHQQKDYLRIYHVPDTKMVSSIPLQGIDAAYVQWSPDDSTLVVWDSFLNCKCLAIDPAFGLRSCFQGKSSSLSIKVAQFSGDSLLLALGSFDDRIRILNKLLFKGIADFELAQSAFQKYKNLLIFREEDRKTDKGTSSTVLIQVQSLKLTQTRPIDKAAVSSSGVSMMSFNAVGTLLASKCQTYPGVLWIFDIKRAKLHSVIQLLNPIKSLAWISEQILAISNSTAKIIFWKPAGAFFMDLPFRPMENLSQSKPMAVTKLDYVKQMGRLVVGDRSCFVTVGLTQQDFQQGQIL